MKKNWINKVVKASGVTQGEVILIHFWGEDSEIDIMHQFAIAVAALSASPLEIQQSRSHNQKLFSVVNQEIFNENYIKLFDTVDAVLDIFTYQPVILGKELDIQQMTYYRSYMKNLFHVFMAKKRFTQIRIPTQENAAESMLNPKEYIDRMTNAYDIDYEELKTLCQKKKEELEQASKIVLWTKEKYHLTLSTKERDWIIDCGNGDWPCGEVYIAPVEEETNGTVFFEKFYIESVGEWDNVTLTIRNGLLMSSNVLQVNNFIQTLPQNSRVVCELGFGMNKNITSLCGYSLLDEKMFGTFHIAIGNNTMFGGKNEADLHMDFVGIAEIERVSDKN